MATQTYVLRGFVKQRSDGRYIGVLLNPNLVVEAKSLREAQHKLQALTEAWIKDAIENNEFEEFMLRRRAPVRAYLTYVVGYVRALLTHRPFAKFKFKKYCPMTPMHA